MNIVDNFKLTVGERKLKKEFLLNKRKTKICTIASSKSIGILFDATDPSSFEIIRNFVKQLENNKKEITVLGYVDDKKLIDHYLYRKGFDFFTKANLNWYNKPENESIKQFISKPFDVLFNLSLKEIYPLQYIIALSKAKLKVGKYSPEQPYLDLMIDIEKEKEAMNGIRKEVMKNKADKDLKSKDYESIASSKASVEIQLNFLINQLLHYISILKK